MLCHLFLVLSLVFSATAQRQYLLDVRPDAIAPPADPGARVGRGSACGSGTSGRVPVNLPLQLSIVSLDKREYLIGERIEYELTVRNVGEKPIAFPRRTGLPGQNALRAIIGLTVGPARPQAGFAPVGLWGSTSDSESFILLMKDDVLRLKASERTQAFNVGALLGSPQQPAIDVGASVMFSTGACEWSQQAVSENTISTQFRQR
jgi:hypothetical protein